MKLRLCLLLVLVSVWATRAAENTNVDAQYLAQARQILREMPLIDGHNDIPWQYRKKANDLNAFDLSKDTSKFGLVTDVPRLRAGGVGGQFWSVYIPPAMSGTVAIRAVMEQIDVVHQLCERYPNDLELALSADDIERIYRKGKIASLIGMEGGHAIDNSLSMLRMMYRMGARYMTLTHTKTLDWADAANDEVKNKGLSPFGEQVVGEMNRLGMLVDISHVSDDTMRHTLRVTKAPVIFSHSSCRALCDHKRNVPDDVLKMLPANGGVMMVNFMPGYLTESARAYAAAEQEEETRLEKLHPNNKQKVETEIEVWRKSRPSPHIATLADVAAHVDHVKSVAGVDYVGIGSDFEGFGRTPKGMEDVSRFPHLMAELLKRGYTKEEIKKIAGENILRVLRSAEQVSAKMRSSKP